MSYESENKKSEQNENVEDNKNLCTSPQNGQTYDNDKNIKDKEKYLNDDMFDEIIPQNDYIKIRTSVINEKMLLDGIKNKKDDTHRDNIIDLFNYTKILFLENKNIIIIQNINLFKSMNIKF
ncbi:leucine-rich repeat protein (LRR8) [Plasmodium ovale curtisi]|uniref:Leucine-rich repeat protein (LRR8) n=1 Tax=Plasmodium ovale curtisi TaxID=864141 RepID=A0A1A8WRQ8_PLAOA|nr:leucine-rich repeat protein (LRR8) [Plasmodium ovale curtisi]